jgi:hypothetical protein
VVIFASLPRYRDINRLRTVAVGPQGFVPKLLVTDKLRSYASAFRQLQLTCLHEQGLDGKPACDAVIRSPAVDWGGVPDGDVL